MDKTLFLLELLTAITPLVLSMPRKYFLIQQAKTWSDARAYCQSNYNDLAMIDSDSNLVRIQKEAQMHKFTDLAWGGLYVNFQSYHWSYGFQPLGSFNQWLSGEPDNWGGYFQCASIASDGWRDTPCDYTMNFVCFDDRFTNSSRFIHYSKLLTWSMAQAYCRQYHTDLAMARNGTENSAVLATGVVEMTWFGLSRDYLYWLDPTIVPPPTFMSGKPDGSMVQNCGLLFNGLADDDVCSATRFFFCYSIYYPLVRIQQTVRLMIKSDKDVNESNLKAAILEKIQQKLQEQGVVQNITLRWKERPNVDTFYKTSQDSNSLN